MYISKQIIDRHEGSIEVLSKYGKGFKFIITLPLLRYKKKATKNQSLTSSSRLQITLHIKMKEIFIVEDDDGIRELLEFLLMSKNYAVKTFPTARAFDNRLPHQTPNLFLLDIMLPDGNRLDLCKQIKEATSTSSIPVVLMSAHAHISSMEGADDFIAKPFDVDDLLERIERQLD